MLKQLPGACLYLVEWADGSTQQQEVVHMFGKLTKKRGLRQGDHILALAMPSRSQALQQACQSLSHGLLVRSRGLHARHHTGEGGAGASSGVL